MDVKDETIKRVLTSVVKNWSASDEAVIWCVHCHWYSKDYFRPPKHRKNCPVLIAAQLLGEAS